VFEWYEDEVLAIEESHRLAPPPPEPVVFYGSSSIRLWDSLGDDFPGIGVVNRGFGGSTLAACVWYFERIVVPCQPRSIVFYAGDNDLGDGQTPAAVLASFHALLAKVALHCPGIPFAFISIKPSPARWPIIRKIQQTNAYVRQELDGYEPGLFIDVFSKMLGPDGSPRRELFADDGLHLSPAGYQLWAEVVGSYGNTIF
jgi:lysophospholipase L1-like esterase